MTGIAFEGVSKRFGTVSAVLESSTDDPQTLDEASLSAVMEGRA